jgi:hypothetical protein
VNNSERFNNSPKSDNETAKSPLEDMPSFEEFREMNWSNSVGNYNNVQPAPEGQPAPEEQLISEKTDSSVAEEKQKTPVPDRSGHDDLFAAGSAGHQRYPVLCRGHRICAD